MIMKFEFEVVESHKLTDSHRRNFTALLRKQNKVQGDLQNKSNRCKLICFASHNRTIIAIGAIKQKTVSAFGKKKAGVPELSSEFEWELGYFYTEEKYQGHGIASLITQALLQSFGNENLMASTEISENPKMVKILEKSGFKRIGHPWKSSLHENYLGLFLRFNEDVTQQSHHGDQLTE